MIRTLDGFLMIMDGRYKSIFHMYIFLVYIYIYIFRERDLTVGKHAVFGCVSFVVVSSSFSLPLWRFDGASGETASLPAFLAANPVSLF